MVRLPLLPGSTESREASLSGAITALLVLSGGEILVGVPGGVERFKPRSSQSDAQSS